MSEDADQDRQQAVRQEAELIELCRRLVEAAKEKGAVLRALGAVAFRIHCPKYKAIEYEAGRYLTDVDMATYFSQLDKVEKVFTEAGFVQDERLKLHGAGRRVFYSTTSDWHSDIFVDELSFCHTVSFKGRLEADYPTIPLAELLLEKLQIVSFEPKDCLDSFVLLREHPVGDSDEETINAGIIARTCADDWGWWKTVDMNLGRIEEFAKSLPYGITAADRDDVLGKIEELKRRIEAAPKSLKWKMRARVGTKRPWYQEVDDLAR